MAGSTSSERNGLTPSGNAALSAPENGSNPPPELCASKLKGSKLRKGSPPAPSENRSDWNGSTPEGAP